MKQVPDYCAGARGGSALQNNGWCQQNQLEPHLLLYVRSPARLLLFFFFTKTFPGTPQIWLF